MPGLLTRQAQTIRAYGSLDVFLEYYQQAKSDPRRKHKRDQLARSENLFPATSSIIGLSS
jgi:hypothetical protein